MTPKEHPRNKLSAVLNGMKQRCYNPNNNRYHRYGGRGITICAEWQENAEKFIEWSLTNGYKEGLQIDRIDNDSNYCPENCRWTTALVNMRNRSLLSKANTTGYRGICKVRNKWKAQAPLNGKSDYIGLYKTPEEAALAYNEYIISNDLGLPLNPISKEVVEEIISKRTRPKCVICEKQLAGFQRKFCGKKHAAKYHNQRVING